MRMKRLSITLTLMISIVSVSNVAGQNLDIKFDPQVSEQSIKEAEQSLKEASSQSEKSKSVLTYEFNDNSYTYIGYSNNSKKDMYNNAKEWVAKNFGDFNRVVKLQDADNYKLVLKGKLPERHDIDTKKSDTDKMILYYLNNQTEFTLTIEAKEGRYRLKFDDIAIDCSVEKEVSLRKTKTSSEHISISTFCTKYKDFTSLVKYDLQKLVDSAKNAIEKAPDNW